MFRPTHNECTNNCGSADWFGLWNCSIIMLVAFLFLSNVKRMRYAPLNPILPGGQSWNLTITNCQMQHVFFASFWDKRFFPWITVYPSSKVMSIVYSRNQSKHPSEKKVPCMQWLREKQLDITYHLELSWFHGNYILGKDLEYCIVFIPLGFCVWWIQGNSWNDFHLNLLGGKKSIHKRCCLPACHHV